MHTEKNIVTATIAGICGLGVACSIVPWLSNIILILLIAAGVAVTIKAVRAYCATRDVSTEARHRETV